MNIKYDAQTDSIYFVLS